eukprot:9306257-Pyramimonas_sp.AAC.1
MSERCESQRTLKLAEVKSLHRIGPPRAGQKSIALLEMYRMSAEHFTPQKLRLRGRSPRALSKPTKTA